MAGAFNIHIDKKNYFAAKCLNTTKAFNLFNICQVLLTTMVICLIPFFFLLSLSIFDFVSNHKCLVLDTTLQLNDQMQKRTVHSSLLTAHSTATFSSCYSDIFLPPPDSSNINSFVSWFHAQYISALDTIATYSTRSISSTNFCP